MRWAGASRARRAVLVTIALLVAACGAPARAADPVRLTVHMTEYSFEPADLAVPAAREVVLTLINDGRVDHDMVVTQFGGQLIRLRGGDSGTVTLRPLAAGTYRVVCSIPTHIELGMVGTIVVR